ncbi:MAG: nitroreductase family protein [Acidobacteriota bacterium]
MSAYDSAHETTVLDLEVETYRRPESVIEPLLYHRWSPRAMSGEALSDDEVQRLFEAARWAPSSQNGQPWRFVYARRGTDDWPRFVSWLVEFNQMWAPSAGLLVVIASRTVFDNGKPCGTHSFDAGAAWQNLALQGRAMGLVVHAMGGFNAEAARVGIGLPEDFAVEAMVAVGRPAPVDVLPERMRKQEHPNARRPIAELVSEGRYREPSADP